jgi:acyl-coenzyme A thioesterase PaaI-like protein
MNAEMLNQALLPHNVCFGCGHENPDGLHIEIYRDADHPDRLKGIFRPDSHMAGFPGITHGGVIYTALDCLAAWVPAVLRRAAKAIWILRSASMTYHKPALEGQVIHLVGFIEEQGDLHEAMTVGTKALNERGELLAEGKFKVIPLPADKFQKITGIQEIPKNWRQFMGEEG